MKRFSPIAAKLQNPRMMLVVWIDSLNKSRNTAVMTIKLTACALVNTFSPRASFSLYVIIASSPPSSPVPSHPVLVLAHYAQALLGAAQSDASALELLASYLDCLLSRFQCRRRFLARHKDDLPGHCAPRC